MAALKDAASAAGCSRIEWTADGDNPPALAFYEAYGSGKRAATRCSTAWRSDSGPGAVTSILSRGKVILDSSELARHLVVITISGGRVAKRTINIA